MRIFWTEDLLKHLKQYDVEPNKGGNPPAASVTDPPARTPEQVAAESVTPAAEVVENEDKTDYSKIDPSNAEQLADLSEEQLAKLAEYQAEHPTKAPDAAEEQTPETDKSVAPEKDKQGEDVKPGEQPAAPVKFAGKFETSDALVKGTEEIAKKLGWNEEYVKGVIEKSKVSNRFDVLEDFYKMAESALGSQAKPKAAEPPPAPVSDTQAGDTSQEALLAVTNLTLQQIMSSPLAARMQKDGFEIPTTPEAVEALREASPYFAIKFEAEWENRFNKNLEEVRAFTTAQKDSATHNAKIISSLQSAVKTRAEQLGVKLSDEEAQQIAEQIPKAETYYQVKHGSKFLDENAGIRYVDAEVLPKKIPDIIKEAEARGRVQHAQDLKANKDKMVSSVSTVPLPGTQRQQKPIDVTDPEQLAGLSDEEIDRLTK